MPILLEKIFAVAIMLLAVSLAPRLTAALLLGLHA
jgi:hypothetical protein